MEAIQETIMYFQKGRLVMCPLLFCSLTVIAISIERFLYYREVDSGQKFAGEYTALLEKGQTAEAKKLAGGTKGRCAQILFEASEITEGRAHGHHGGYRRSAHRYRDRTMCGNTLAVRNAGISGTVMLRLLVGTDGLVESVTVLSSSGNVNLDAAATTAIKRWKFTSARNQAGRNVRCYLSIPITFRIKG